MKVILLSLFVALLMVGCGEDAVDYSNLQDRDGIMYLPNEETPFTGRAESFYENGNKRATSTFKNEKMMTQTRWKPNGEKCPVTNVVNGNGVVVVYEEGGTETVRLTFKHGEPVLD